MRKAFGVFLIPALLLAAQAAFAQADAKTEAKTEAKGHFEAGLALFKAEKYDAAALELQVSVKLYPTKGGLFNLANAYKILSRYDDAIEMMDRLEQEYGATLDAEMKGALDRMRAEIKTLAARLEVTVEPAGAVVTVDGRKVGKSPLPRPVLVDPGEHVVRATLAGYSATEATARVISRQTGKVSLVLARDAGSVESGEGEDKAVAAREADREKLAPGWFWAGLGATVAFGGVTLGLELAVRSNKDDLANTSALDKNERMQKAGIAFLGLTAAAAVTTAVLAGFTEFGKEEETSVAVGVAPSGVVLLGRF